MTYTSPLRRRARAGRRLAAGVCSPAVWRSGVVVPAYWWDGHPNFGDALTPWLLPKYGILPVHRMAARARMSAVGSVIQFLPTDFAGAIWGSGLIRDEERPLPSARVLAVRGPLTRDRIGAAASTALGDPGILVSRHVRRPAVRWDVGLVPHGHHRSHSAFLALAATVGLRVRVIDVHQEAATAVRQIAACATVVTTSLHGLVTADAFGIPAVWTSLEPPLEGGDFKFHDYEGALPRTPSRRVTFGAQDLLRDLRERARAADPGDVRTMGDGLVAALAGLEDAIGPLPRLPRGLSGVFRD
ncbi:polysaccharide pyruvyl transferase family protein [Microbacterium lacus]|uniref:Polysaccharide pyruvyl transferase family protein n=1 Tax=Microbacterium lacus TaxID=415217 RepID=A0ABN2G2G4_9MICO